MHILHFPAGTEFDFQESDSSDAEEVDEDQLRESFYSNHQTELPKFLTQRFSDFECPLCDKSLTFKNIKRHFSTLHLGIEPDKAAIKRKRDEQRKQAKKAILDCLSQEKMNCFFCNQRMSPRQFEHHAQATHGMSTEEVSKLQRGHNFPSFNCRIEKCPICSEYMLMRGSTQIHPVCSGQVEPVEKVHLFSLTTPFFYWDKVNVIFEHI